MSDEPIEIVTCECGFDAAQCAHKQEVGGCRLLDDDHPTPREIVCITRAGDLVGEFLDLLEKAGVNIEVLPTNLLDRLEEEIAVKLEQSGYGAELDTTSGSGE